VALLLLVWLGFEAWDSLESLEKKNMARRDALHALTAHALDLVRLNEEIGLATRRLGQPEPGKTIVPILEDIITRLSLKEAVRKMNQGESRRVEGFVESTAELELERLDLNQVVNLIYRIQNGRSFVKVNSMSIERDFQNPELLNLSLTLSLVAPLGES